MYQKGSRKSIGVTLGALTCSYVCYVCQGPVIGKTLPPSHEVGARPTRMDAASPLLSGSHIKGTRISKPDARYNVKAKGGIVALQQSKGRHPNDAFALFILFSWNFDLFYTSLQTYLAAGWGEYVIVVDNSNDRKVLHNPDVERMVAEVIPTRVQLTFAQLQNFIADIAIERNYKYYFWGHADVALLASNATASFLEETLGCVEQVTKLHPKWGILYFTYDWFSAIRTDLVREVKYDIFITVYMSDCDFYPRVRAAGWQTLNYNNWCPGISPRAYDLKRPVNLPLGDYEHMKKILEEEERNENIDRNAWKRNEWKSGEDAGWDNWGRASLTYFRLKWGSTGESGDDCKEIEVPGTAPEDVVLRQQPFKEKHDRRLLFHSMLF